MLSAAKIKILKVFLEEIDQSQYGFALMQVTRVKSGSLYPILEALERNHWVESYWESIDEHAEGRPRRRLYRLTALGEQEAKRSVAEFYQDVGRAPAWVPGIERA